MIANALREHSEQEVSTSRSSGRITGKPEVNFPIADHTLGIDPCQANQAYVGWKRFSRYAPKEI
jgi:hypothetical protein